MVELLILTILVEAATELTKDIRRKGFTVHQIVALGFGQVLAWGTKLNVFKLVGVEGAIWLDYVGIALTGLIMSRGANYVHGLWDRIGSVNKDPG